MNYNVHKEIYKEKPIYNQKEIVEINDKSKIEIGLYKKANEVYYTVILKILDKEIFLGKFSYEAKDFKVYYYNGKVLICNVIFDSESYSFKVSQVLSLYEILDNLFYSCTEEQALKIFDPFMDRKFLENKDRSIFRNDAEKKRRNRENTI